MSRRNLLKDRPVPKDVRPAALADASNIGQPAAPKRSARRRLSACAAEPQGWRATFMGL